MGETISRLAPNLPPGPRDERFQAYDVDEGDVTNVTQAPINGMLVPGFATPLPTSYGRDLGVAIRVSEGATLPSFPNDYSVGAQLFFFRACGPFGGKGEDLWDTGVAFVLPPYLTALITGPLVETKFLDPDDRNSVILTPSANAIELLDGKDPIQCETVVASIVFLPILRPDFLLDPPTPPPASSEIEVVPQAEVVIAAEP